MLALGGVNPQVPRCCVTNKRLNELHQVQAGGMKESVSEKALVTLSLNSQTSSS